MASALGASTLFADAPLLSLSLYVGTGNYLLFVDIAHIDQDDGSDVHIRKIEGFSYIPPTNSIYHITPMMEIFRQREV